MPIPGLKAQIHVGEKFPGLKDGASAVVSLCETASRRG